MKRALSIILTLAMLVSMFTVFAVTPVSAATVIKNTSPAITATVGTKITLSNYSVTFDGDTSATSGVTWKNGSTTITEFTPSAKGVTVLTATSGSKTKNIYVVAKNASDTEYVLYEANMADFASTSALTSAGWTLPDTASVSGDALTITGNATAGTAYLPSWLGDFGDYGFSANAKLTSVNEDTRWFALVYRSDNRNGTANFSQMCIRNNTTAANGIEFSENTSSGWNVISKAAASYTTMTDAYRSIEAQVSGGNVKYSIGGTQVLYMSSSSYTSKTGLTKGHLGLTASGSTLSVKSVKVVLQESVPEQLPAGLNLIYNNYHDTENLVTPIANVQKVSSATAANLSNLSVAYIDLTGDADATAALNACVAANVVPTFYITTNAMADKVVSAVSSTGKYDVNVISNSATVLSYINGKNSKIRKGLSLSIATEMADGVLTSKEAHSIRTTVRSAPATFIVIDSKYAVTEAVNALNELAVAVWVNVASTPGTDAFRLEAITALTSGAHGIISSSASSIEEIINNDFAPNTFTRLSAGIGHAGNYDVAEENTMESFIAAYENGADILELDMGITSDGVPVLLHDNSIKRTTTYTGTKNIWEMTWAEVQQYPVVNTRTGVNTGKPIPKFEELLQFVKGKDLKLFVEFKWNAYDMIPKAIELINKYDMMDQCDFISFYGNCIGAIQSLAPGASTSFIFNNDSNDIKGTNATYAQSLLSLDHWIATAQTYKSTISCPRYVPVTNDLMQAATDRGITVWPWTYDTNSTNDAFFACVDGMTMIHAQDLKDMVKTVSVDNLEMFVGQTYSGGALTATTYSRYSFSVTGANTIATVVSGDAVKVENGKLVAVKEGTAKVIFGCKTNTYMGSEYVVYTQPVEVTVGGNSANVLKPLIEMAETATINSLPEADLAELRQLYAKATALVASADPSKTEVQSTATAMAELIDSFISVSYTTTAPNYDYWENAALLDDDGIRLMDGKKQATSGDTAAYSAWGKTSTGTVEFTVDFGSTAVKDTFNAYFAYNTGWGIIPPSAMTVSYSDNGTSWTDVNTTLSVTETKAPDESSNWGLQTFSAKASTPVSARYMKFTVTPGVGSNFIWVDEIELLDSNFSLAYISNVNTALANGDCNVFTSDFGAITNASASITWASIVIAKWDNAKGAYVVKEVYGSNYDGNTFNLEDDEIMIAAHDWETNLAGQAAVVGSAFNKAKVASAQVGDVVEFVGVDTETWEFTVAPGLKFVNETTVEPDPEIKKGDLNGNDEIDAIDYTLCKRGYFGTFTVDVETGDINNNSELDAIDYTLIKRAYFGTYIIE